MGVKVYTITGCVSCIKVVQLLKNKGISFELINVSENKEAMNRLRKLNVKILPFIEINDKQIEGFQPEEILQLLKQLQSDIDIEWES